MPTATKKPKASSNGSLVATGPPAGARAGYKHTKLGWIPEDWTVARISDISNVVRGSSPRPGGSPLYFNGDALPWLTVAEITSLPDSEKEIHSTASRLTHEGVNFSRILEAGTLVLANSGATLGVPKILSIRACANDGVAAFLDLQQERVDQSYLYYLLQDLTKHFREVVAPGNGQPNLNTTLIGSTQLGLPTISEQRRIADMLGAWDRAIATTQQLVAAQQQRKQGLMHELLTGKRRFPGFKGKWKNVRLGDLVERVTRKNDVGEDHVLTISALQGLIDQREIFNKSVAGANLAGYYLIKHGEFAYNKSSSNGFPFGAIKRLDRYEQGVLSTLYICFRLKPDAGDSDFFAAYFDSGLMDQGISMVAQEGARNHGLLNIGTTDFFDIDMHIPAAEEQEAIAVAVRTLNTETETLQNYLTHLTAQKRGLMQQLLTGQTRVKA